MYDELATRVNVIDTKGFVLKTQYNTDNSGLEKKINDADEKYQTLVNLSKNRFAKITEIEGKILILTGLAATAALNAVENKIPNISNLVTKRDYDAKISYIEDIYFSQI